jgi:hypothetical protein
VSTAETPANPRIDENAGDVVGILRGSYGKTNTVALSAGQPHRLQVLTKQPQTPS